MKLQFLGTGSAFIPISINYQSNMILKADNGKKLLIDCGSDARHSLAEAGMGYKDIDSVYISHFHADHSGGLEWLAFTTRFDSEPSTPSLIAHPTVLPRLWEHVLKGGLQSIEGKSPAELGDYFNVIDVQDDKFTWESINFLLVQTIHVYNGPQLLPSYGLFFVTPKTRVFITTDTQFKPDLFMDYYKKVDIIFHDCETSKHKGDVHSHFTELATLEPSIKSKMWLYHYANSTRFDALANGFAGFVKKGQEFEI